MISLVVLTLAATSLAAPQFIQQPEEGVPPTAAAAAPAKYLGDGASSETPVPIISQTENIGIDGSYNFSFESADGVHREESGFLKTSVSPPTEGRSEDDDGTAQVQQGSFSYTAPDGVQYKLSYIADELGFRATGDHLPTAPLAQANILRAVQEASAAEGADTAEGAAKTVGVAPETTAAASGTAVTTATSSQTLVPQTEFA